MIYLISAAIAAAAWRFGDWRHWERYYPTILYLIIGDLTYNMLFQGQLLWSYRPEYYGHILGNLFVTVTMYPAMGLIYLSCFPAKRLLAAFWVAGWTALLSLIEGIWLLTGSIGYSDDWTIGYSAAVSLGLFLMVKLHYHRPLLAWPLSFAAAFLLLSMFPNPAIPN